MDENVTSYDISGFASDLVSIMSSLLETIAETIENLKDILSSLSEKFSELFEKIKSILNQLVVSYLNSLNGRVLYLSMHAKRYRSRKKNKNRLRKLFLKEIAT